MLNHNKLKTGQTIYLQDKKTGEKTAYSFYGHAKARFTRKEGWQDAYVLMPVDSFMKDEAKMQMFVLDVDNLLSGSFKYLPSLPLDGLDAEKCREMADKLVPVTAEKLPPPHAVLVNVSGQDYTPEWVVVGLCRLRHSEHQTARDSWSDALLYAGQDKATGMDMLFCRFTGDFSGFSDM